MQLNRKKNTLNSIVAVTVLTFIIYLNSINRNLPTKLSYTRLREKKPTRSISQTSTETPTLETKYILLWTDATSFPFVYLGIGNTVFKDKKCKFQNCYVTNDRSYLGSYSDFDVIAFNGPQLGDVKGRNDLPKIRLPRQKYVYANIEAAVYYPICNTYWDRFFNWTWTYKLNSDAVWGYILIKNASNHVIGPSDEIDWIDHAQMEPIDDDIKAKLCNKTKAAAWFVSNCRTMSEREKYVISFQNYISGYNLNVDVYGDCGDFQCPRTIMHRCLAELQRNYYFYFAFENAISEDYVTEKILHALNYYTVPVVFGGANYTRFLPPGSYLDALELGPQLLASKIYEIVQKPELYYEYFKWRRYYSFHLRHESPDTDDYCRFCAMINDEVLTNETTVYNNFSAWWTPVGTCKENNKPAQSEDVRLHILDLKKIPL